MKKQYFIISAIACMTAIFSVKAQNTPIDDILKGFSSREGITIVSMGEPQLKSMFTPPKILTMKEEHLFLRSIGDKTPTYYSSVTISRKDIPKNMIENTISLLMNYEKFMEINKEGADVLVYLSNYDEVMVLRQQTGFFSAIYLAGLIDLSQVDMYLQVIKQSLDSRYKTTSSTTTTTTTRNADNFIRRVPISSPPSDEEIKAILKIYEEKFKMGQISQEEMLKFKWQFTPLSDEEINSLLKINEERFKMGRISETEMLAKKRQIEEMKKR